VIQKELENLRMNDVDNNVDFTDNRIEQCRTISFALEVPVIPFVTLCYPRTHVGAQ